ncbi:MAG TPA: 3-hydroxyacyl-CoA dehydrogenase NAD-binding domain-containing protein, partial [Vicinamibacteria bacterium]|nr:3-hydroxyacyl-CoA dehydrogenase NAD-binding domain-containing protein [Vicinamibacteria bacterium]
MTVGIRKVVVLGAGTMGAQVAAHLVGMGLDVALLDLAADGPDRSAPARRALEVLRKARPSPLHLPGDAAHLRVGNFDDHWHELKDADWVLEAVVEDLDVKKRLLQRVGEAVKDTTVVTTNTSGLSVAAMAEGLPAPRRKRFLGTHF